MIVYRITNRLNGRQYIGRTVKKLRKRWNAHYNAAIMNRHPSIALHNAIRKYGSEVFRVEVLARFTTHNEMLDGERLFIAIHRIVGIDLYNLTEGGDGSLGLRHGEEAKTKLRKSALARDQKHTSVRRRPCVFDGIEYPSIAEAARRLDTSYQVVRRWLRNGTSRVVAKRSDYKGFQEPYSICQRIKRNRIEKHSHSLGAPS